MDFKEKFFFTFIRISVLQLMPRQNASTFISFHTGDVGGSLFEGGALGDNCTLKNEFISQSHYSIYFAT